MNQIVEFYETKESVRLRDHSDKFSFREDKKYHWLQRLCLNTLKKIGAYAKYEDVHVTRHRVDTDDLIKAIRKQNHIVQRVHGRKPQTLYIGNETFSKLMSMPDIMHLINPMEFFTPQGKNIFGLKVVIVPWMEGFLVTP